MSGLDHARLVKIYVKMRNEKARITREAEAAALVIKEQMEEIERLLLGSLNTLKADNMKTEFGTFYKELLVLPAVDDWSAYYEFMAEEKAFEGLEKRVSKGFITSYLKDNKDQTPPGITVRKEYVARVRVNKD